MRRFGFWCKATGSNNTHPVIYFSNGHLRERDRERDRERERAFIGSSPEPFLITYTVYELVKISQVGDPHVD